MFYVLQAPQGWSAYELQYVDLFLCAWLSVITLNCLFLIALSPRAESFDNTNSPISNNFTIKDKNNMHELFLLFSGATRSVSVIRPG
jgi:hypothetical protein